MPSTLPVILIRINTMSGFLKNTSTIIGLLIIGGLGYYLFVMQKDDTVSLNSDSTVEEARLASARFIRELNAIKSLEISDNLFNDPRFRSFVDFSRPVPPQSVGRSNPFAPTE